MKKFITSVVLVAAATFASAQESITVKMNMKIEGLPAEYAGFGEQEIVNYMKGEKYKQEMTSMMGSSTTLFDGKTMTSVSEAMGEKSGFTATKEEMEAGQKDDKNEPKPKVEYTADKKMIAGYECTKAIVTSTNAKTKKDEKVTVWVTDKIKAPEAQMKTGGRRGGMNNFGDLKGYPLEIEMAQAAQGQEMKIIISASEVSTANLDDNTFKVSTDGYKMYTYKEYQDKMKAASKGGQ